MNHLTRGRGLSPSEAKTKFGVRNLRATISDIREEVQQQIEPALAVFVRMVLGP